MSLKDSGMRIRVEKELREAFVQACRAKIDTPLTCCATSCAPSRRSSCKARLTCSPVPRENRNERADRTRASSLLPCPHRRTWRPVCGRAQARKDRAGIGAQASGHRGDPQGDLARHRPARRSLSSIRSAAERRAVGAVYTPAPIVRSMMTWLASQGTPARIVDPGAGSGRFILAAGLAFPDAQLVAVEMDPWPR